MKTNEVGHDDAGNKFNFSNIRWSDKNKKPGDPIIYDAELWINVKDNDNNTQNIMVDGNLYIGQNQVKQLQCPIDTKCEQGKIWAKISFLILPCTN